jgi:hypothetical protein
MSNRSLIEINHDFAGQIKRRPEGFALTLYRYLLSGSPQEAYALEEFGIRVFGMRHHSNAFDIDWAGKKISEPKT